jgi:ADP-heptose:LPS heptosyltransferase/2-polyprenyl-3-methyl-5-hydroxy-6-metoxy-1,4-benzoquinol methylase
MARKKVEDTLVSVILLAEDTEMEHVKAAIENVLEQLHQNFELLVSSQFDTTALAEKYLKDWRIRFFKAEEGTDYLKEVTDTATGEIIFYKTVTNVLWWPRHIQAHVEEFNNNQKIKWCLSHTEYRDVANADHPLNTIGYRIENPPPVDKIILDEICHKSDLKIDWTSCVTEHNGNPLFVAGLVLQPWTKQGLVGSIPNEITIVQWITFGEDSGATSEEDIAKQIGIPATQEVKEENKFIDGNVEVVRVLPTVMGNSHIDEEHNNQVREYVKNTEGVKSIGLKRTMGMGDVILCEPIIKKLKQKYPDAKITFYTGKTDVVDYFVNKPDDVISIAPDQLLQDFLSTTDNQIKFDLDLAYESRKGMSFIDAYAAVCDVKWDDYKDKHVQLEVENQIDYSHLKPFVVVVGDGSGWIGKTWDEENYRNVISDLKNKYTVVEPGMQGHSGLTETKYQGCPMNELMSLMNQCEFYIGGDNGPMHISRGLNIPSVIVAGAALPYFTNPNREGVFYVQDNSLECLGCKHTQFFSRANDSLTFVPTCINQDPGVCMKTIEPEHVLMAVDKVTKRPISIIDDVTPLKFYFNIPGWAYYHDPINDLIQREKLNEHPDQEKDISTEYDFRWEEIYEKYSKTFVKTVQENFEFTTGVSTFLDVGCNMGLVVKAAYENGWDAYGIDINNASVEKAWKTFPELLERVGQPNAIESKCEVWDVIVMNQTLEHISDPITFLSEWKNKLSDDGLMFIGIPSMDEEDARNNMQRFQTIGTGEHTWLPTNKSFDVIMEKAGLKYESLQDTGKGIFVKAWK